MSDTDNTKRNRWLIAALGLVALFYFGDIGYRKLIQEPGESNERLLGIYNKKIKEAKLALAQSNQVVEQLEEIEKRSLPWDPEMARSRYQGWLLQLAEDAKLAGTSVDSGEPVLVSKPGGRGRQPIALYRRFNFSLRGRGDLKQATQFLYAFYRGGHLHKIRSMSLNPVGQGQQVDMNLAIEALAIPSADREAELTSLVSERLAMQDVRDYQLISRRNFFSHGGTQSAWRQIVLTAITSNASGVSEAWIKAGESGRSTLLKSGQTLSLPAFDMEILQLDQRQVTVDVDGEILQFAIGQSLADAVPVQP